MCLFEGSATALVTPMNEDFSVNYDEFRVLVQRCVDQGVPAIVVNGTTGEASTLTADEKHKLVKIALEIAKGKCKVIAGSGSNNTSAAIEESKAVEKLGVDGLLIVTPYYNKTSQRGLIAHYEAIAKEVNLPIILYNVPSRTGVNIDVDTVCYLAKNPHIVGLKDATGNMSYTMKVLSLTKDIEDFAVYSGNDDLILPMIAAGSKGVISVVSNIYPRETELLCQYTLKGEIEKARQLAYDFHEVMIHLFTDVNPINVKAALQYQGICKETLRLPLIPTTEEKKAALYHAMKKFESKEY